MQHWTEDVTPSNRLHPGSAGVKVVWDSAVQAVAACRGNRSVAGGVERCGGQRVRRRSRSAGYLQRMSIDDAITEFLQLSNFRLVSVLVV